MTSIIDWAVRVWEVITRLLLKIQPIAGLASVFTFGYLSSSDMMADLVVRIDTLVSVVSGLGTGAVDFRPLAFVNFVFPLTEFCGLLLGYLSLLAASSVVRIVKSFIPTIA